MAGSDNGIYYFLGNITSHVLHALPLYENLGGTFVVLSEKAKEELSRYDVPVLVMDDCPSKLMRIGRTIKRVHEYTKIDRKLKRTTDYLNATAKVVLFYELYDFAPEVRLHTPKTVFLTHGNMLKDYMSSGNRISLLKQYDYMAALGPYLKKKFVEHDGVPATKLIDIGIARTDEIVKHRGKVLISHKLIKESGINPNLPVVSYLPTFWGNSSIYDLALPLIRHFPDEYTLIFRPHPQTPAKLLKKILHEVDTKPNIIHAPEGRYSSLGLLDIYAASSAIIGDFSSVMLEAILTEKPLVFVQLHDNQSEYDSIASVVEASFVIRTKKDITDTIRSAVGASVDRKLWKSAIDEVFFHADGSSVKAIAKAVQKLL